MRRLSAVPSLTLAAVVCALALGSSLVLAEASDESAARINSETRPAQPLPAKISKSNKRIDVALQQAVASPLRTPAFAARDRYRHPLETLSFFGIRRNMTVVEVWPGSGWYTEILAPYLYPHGTLFAAQFNPSSSSPFFRKTRADYLAMLLHEHDRYGNVVVTSFEPPDLMELTAPDHADLVLTFRNVHNWYIAGGDTDVLAAFGAMYTTLKPGGILGVVEHRLPASHPESEQATSGYLHESYVVHMAEQAGFKLVASSPINNNPADKADYPHGVWTLPPTLDQGDINRDKYLAIGESDRMTLKFVKPALGRSK